MTDRAAFRGASRVKKFKARLAAGETVLGAWLTIPELSVAEIMAGSGFDYVIIDAEHTCMTLRGVQSSGSRTVTSSLRGLLRDDARTRAEFLSLARAS